MTLLAAPEGRHILLDNLPSMLRGRAYNPLPPAWPAKDPAEIVWVSVGWERLIDRRPIIQIQTDVLPAGAVTIPQTAFDATTVRMQVAGGTPGQPVTIAVSVVLTDGQVLRRDVLLPIVLRGDVPPPPDAITVNTLPLVYGSDGFELPPAGTASS